MYKSLLFPRKESPNEANDLVKHLLIILFILFIFFVSFVLPNCKQKYISTDLISKLVARKAQNPESLIIILLVKSLRIESVRREEGN